MKKYTTPLALVFLVTALVALPQCQTPTEPHSVRQAVPSELGASLKGLMSVEPPTPRAAQDVRAPAPADAQRERARSTDGGRGARAPRDGDTPADDDVAHEDQVNGGATKASVSGAERDAPDANASAWG